MRSLLTGIVCDFSVDLAEVEPLFDSDEPPQPPGVGCYEIYEQLLELANRLELFLKTTLEGGELFCVFVMKDDVLGEEAVSDRVLTRGSLAGRCLRPCGQQSVCTIRSNPNCERMSTSFDRIGHQIRDRSACESRSSGSSHLDNDAVVSTGVTLSGQLVSQLNQNCSARSGAASSVSGFTSACSSR